jgi:hypothetical protein
VNLGKIITQWLDMARVAGSLVTNQVLLRPAAHVQPQWPALPVGHAFAEYGRVDKTLHLLGLLDPIDTPTGAPWAGS